MGDMLPESSPTSMWAKGEHRERQLAEIMAMRPVIERETGAFAIPQDDFWKKSERDAYGEENQESR